MGRKRLYRDLAFAFLALLCMVLMIEAIRGLKYERVLSLFMMLICFSGLVYYTMLRGRRTNLGGFRFRLPMPFLKALLTRRYSLVTNRSVLNMLLFVPFGCLLPYNYSLWERTTRDKRLRFKTVIFIGLLTSFIIEICQLVFKVGVFEVDDLVKNTMGTGIGYMIFRILVQRNNNVGC